MLRKQVLPLLEEQERSQRWLARKVGVDPALLHRYLSGQVLMPEGRFLRMAEALGVAPDELRPREEVAA